MVPLRPPSAFWQWLIALMVLLGGATVRFYQLGTEPLWTDELESWRQGHFPTVSAVIWENTADIHPPGHRVLLFFTERLFGESELALRWPSAVAGVLTLAALYQLGRRLYGRTEGWLAAAGLLAAWVSIAYSQEARAYALLLLTTTLTLYWWVGFTRRWQQGHSARWPEVVAYGVVGVAGAYFHYYGLYVLGLQAAGAFFYVVRHPRRWPEYLALYALCALAYAPWVPTMWGHLNQGAIWIPTPGDYLPTLLDYLRFVFSQADWLRDGVLLVVALGGGLSVIELAQKRSQLALMGWLLGSSMLLLVWLLLPFTGVYLKSIWSAPVLTFRNLIISVPAAYLLLARAIRRVAGRPPVAALGAVALLGASLYQLIGPLQYYSAQQKGQFREGVAFVAAQLAQDPHTLFIGYSWQEDYINYYLARAGSPRRVDVFAGNRPEIPAVEAALAAHQPARVWYLRAFREPESEFLAYLRERLHETSYQEFAGPETWLYTEVWGFESP